VEIEKPAGQRPIVDDRKPVARNPFGIERTRSKAAPAQRIIEDGNALAEQLLAELVLEKARALGNRRSKRAGDEIADQARGDPRIIDDGKTLRFDLAGL